MLNTSTRSRLTAAFTTAYEAKENTGSHLHTVCEIAAKAGEMDKEDHDAIAESVAAARKWKDKTRDSRMSEVRVILRASAKLPDAITALAAKGQREWHVVMRAARKLAKGKSVKEAVAFALEGGGSGSSVPPSGRVASALKLWFGSTKGQKRADIIKAADLLGLSIKGINA